MTEQQENNNHCEELVREFDHDRYLTILYADQHKRQDLFALYAFNYEISKIRESVSEPMLGEIRLQWWREAIDDIFKGQIRAHDIMAPLAAAINDHDLSRDLFMAYFEGQALDLYPESPADCEELERGLSKTVGSLEMLALRILGQKDCDDLANSLGIAGGYVKIITSISYDIRLGKNFIPLNLMDKYSENNIGFLSMDEMGVTKEIIRHIWEKAQAKLNHINSCKGRIDANSRSLFLFSSVMRSSLIAIKKADYNPFILDNRKNALSRQWRLLMAALFNRI